MQEKVNRRHPPTKKIKKIEVKTLKKRLDIGKLVDECFVDEKDYCDDVKDERENKNKEEEYPDSDPENFKNLSPTFNLTFEEDFKIHELMVRKEKLFEEFYNIFLEFPNFVNLWKRFLFQIQTSSPVIQSGVPADSYDCNMKNMVRDNFVKGWNSSLWFKILHAIILQEVL